MSKFILTSDYKPTGDQPEAIRQLTEGLDRGDRAQVLLGVTGSGKTFTMANVIAQHNRPTLILSHNKTLAAQLYEEMKGFFPQNAVESPLCRKAPDPEPGAAEGADREIRPFRRQKPARRPRRIRDLPYQQRARRAFPQLRQDRREDVARLRVRRIGEDRVERPRAPAADVPDVGSCYGEKK